jgi:transcription elongation factor Elf1
MNKLRIHLSGVHRDKYAQNIKCGICGVVFATEAYLKVSQADCFSASFSLKANV